MLSGLRKTASRVRWNVVWDTYDVFVREVRDGDDVFNAPDGYSFHFGTRDDVLGCDVHHTELDATDRAHGAERLGLEHRVVVARFDGTPVFTMWVNPRNLNVPHYVKRQLHPHQVFIYKAFTSPEHRGRKLYQAGMRFVLADLAVRGLTEVVGYAARAKKISRAGLGRLDFRTVGSFKGYGYGRPTLVRESKDLVRAFPIKVARTDLGLT
ncbi:hypothetical protein Pla163_15940 [Planctomycetes bacterium Pla163]|uniref:N-acetyltransferase domain-containing protein n=1 Tax=Rohdeia mirabilis TaxID=2528008 RepID=A0A518CZ28_9BACT|nr:hypothetical protein Pla163_15940 [Planctomycetes bacterium Pla163]